MAAAIVPWLSIATTAIPEVAALVKSVLALRQKYPTLTQDQIVTMVTQITGQGDPEFLAAIQELSAIPKGPA